MYAEKTIFHVRNTETGLESTARVSNVLGYTKHELSKKSLNAWEERTGVEAAKAYTAKACDFGTRFHTAAEDYLLGQLKAVDADVKPYLDAAIPKLEELKKIQAWIELPVYHPELRYNGTADLAWVEDRALWIGDWKTKLNYRQGYWDTNLMQGWFYLEALHTVTGIPKGGVKLFRLNPNRKGTKINLEERSISVDDPEGLFFTFNVEAQMRLQEYWRHHIVTKRVVSSIVTKRACNFGA